MGSAAPGRRRPLRAGPPDVGDRPAGADPGRSARDRVAVPLRRLRRHPGHRAPGRPRGHQGAVRRATLRPPVGAGGEQRREPAAAARNRRRQGAARARARARAARGPGRPHPGNPVHDRRSRDVAAAAGPGPRAGICPDRRGDVSRCVLGGRPVLDDSGSVAAAVGIVVPSLRRDAPRLVAALTTASAGITRQWRALVR